MVLALPNITKQAYYGTYYLYDNQFCTSTMLLTAFELTGNLVFWNAGLAF